VYHGEDQRERGGNGGRGGKEERAGQELHQNKNEKKTEIQKQ